MIKFFAKGHSSPQCPIRKRQSFSSSSYKSLSRRIKWSVILIAVERSSQVRTEKRPLNLLISRSLVNWALKDCSFSKLAGGKITKSKLRLKEKAVEAIVLFWEFCQWTNWNRIKSEQILASRDDILRYQILKCLIFMINEPL